MLSYFQGHENASYNMVIGFKATKCSYVSSQNCCESILIGLFLYNNIFARLPYAAIEDRLFVEIHFGADLFKSFYQCTCIETWRSVKFCSISTIISTANINIESCIYGRLFPMVSTFKALDITDCVYKPELERIKIDSISHPFWLGWF